MANIIDIDNEEEIIKKVGLYMHGFRQGLYGLAKDFGFHIDNVWENKRIFELSENIRYRLFSSKFHFHLLYNNLLEIRKKHQIIINKDVPEILHLEIDKKEQSSLMDSIVFHVSSIMDYVGTLINYIISKNTDSVDWSSVRKSAKSKSNIFSKENTDEVCKIVNEIESDFVNNLYAYRSELIHNSNDVCGYEHNWDAAKNIVSVNFYCTKKAIRHLKKMGNKDDKFTISFFAQYIIFETIDSLRKIIQALRMYLKDNLKGEDFIVSNKKPLIYFDKDGNKLGAASIFNWQEFDSVFPNKP